MISITADQTIVYPDPENFYSPDERFPEYRYAHISTKTNPVYRAVRNCFAQADLDRKHLGQSSWNPLGDFIQPATRVFVLCNFVFHRVADESAEDFAAKCIHGAVLRALVDYLLLAVGENGSVAFGNAPMQFCHWESVLRDTGAQVVEKFYQSNGVPVKAKDLRLFVGEKNRYGAIKKIERRNEADGVAVDLAADSLLVDLDRNPLTPYRVMNYNPARTEGFHAHGSHTYIINRHILEADAIVSLPKLKTHEKVGITCALKGFVGAVAHKDSLPHHRYGPPINEGDEYPSDRTGLLRMASALHDRVQQVTPDRTTGNLLRVADRIVHKVLEPVGPVTEGAWWGNDTAWRMVLDLARIATYASATGEMQTLPLRKHLILVDGIIGGEGQGPLFPEAVYSGSLLFSDNLLAVDYACASLMGLDPGCLPLIREALKLSKYPLIEHQLENEWVIYNSRSIPISELISLASYHYKPPLGWKGKYRQPGR